MTDLELEEKPWKICTRRDRQGNTAGKPRVDLEDDGTSTDDAALYVRGTGQSQCPGTSDPQLD